MVVGVVIVVVVVVVFCPPLSLSLSRSCSCVAGRRIFAPIIWEKDISEPWILDRSFWTNRNCSGIMPCVPHCLYHHQFCLFFVFKRLSQNQKKKKNTGSTQGISVIAKASSGLFAENSRCSPAARNKSGVWFLRTNTHSVYLVEVKRFTSLRLCSLWKAHLDMSLRSVGMRAEDRPKIRSLTISAELSTKNNTIRVVAISVRNMQKRKKNCL